MRGVDEPIKSILFDDVISMYSILSSCRSFSTFAGDHYRTAEHKKTGNEVRHEISQ